jgi:GNAT superfamily N-acetyltransferase
VNARIRLAETREEIASCYAVMVELRPHLEAAQFVEQVIRQQAEGYRLAFLMDAGVVKACAGYRISECLSSGRFMYVDDLVTASAARSRGFGGELFEWLVTQARTEGCVQFQLDSGVQRFGAHRFYLMKRMDITAHHFGLKL